MVNIPNHTLTVNDDGSPGSAKTKPSPQVIQPFHSALRVTYQWKRDVLGLPEPLQSFYAVSADADYHGVSQRELFLKFYKLPRLQRSTKSESPEEKVENYVCPPAVRECELPPGAVGRRKIWCGSSKF